MTLLEALRTQTGVRVSCGDKWLTRNFSGLYTVYFQGYNQRKVRISIETYNEEDAVQELLEE